MDIKVTFWHRARAYFKYIKALWWLVTVPNMNKVNTFISEISQQSIFMKKLPKLLKFGTDPNSILET